MDFKDELARYFEDQGAQHAYLFGSMARGKETPDSDCDLAVLMPEPWDPKDGLRCAAVMESELRALCGRPVDLVFLNDASALLRFEVIRYGQVLYTADDSGRQEMEKRARDAYEEYVYIQSFFIEALKERLAS